MINVLQVTERMMIRDNSMTRAINTVGSSTYERIKKDIIFGTLAPGSKLKLDALKQQYEASVSTLRETLNRLSSDGFVEAAEQRGFFVRSVSKEDLTEIANLRILLECSALKTSIENGDADWERQPRCRAPQASPYGRKNAVWRHVTKRIVETIRLGISQNTH